MIRRFIPSSATFLIAPSLLKSSFNYQHNILSTPISANADVDHSSFSSSAALTFQTRSKVTIHKSTRGDLSAEDQQVCATKTLNQLWYEACLQYGDSPAFTDAHSGTQLTFNQTGIFTRQTEALLRAATSGNLKPNGVVCVFSPNSISYGIWVHAALSLGAIVSPANPIYTAEELRRHLRLSKAKVLITIPNTPFEKVAREAIATFDTSGPNRIELVLLPTNPFQANLPETSATLPLSPSVRTSISDVVALPFSSGTTGLPKGVQLTNSNIVTNCKQILHCLPLRRDNSFISILPFYHIYGFTASLHLPMFSGCHQAVMSKFDLHLYRESIPKYKTTHLFIAPPIAVMLAKCPDLPKIDTSSVELILSGAASLGEEVIEILQPRFAKAQIIQGYGLTECSPVTHFTDVKNNKKGSIGPLAPSTFARLINADGKDVPESRQGELWIKGPQVMKGYLNQSDTDAVFSPDGWFMTGDIARIDSDGTFYITDRIKELVKYNGLQVPPAELEGILLSHPSVKDCLVFGIPDENYGELPTAHVVLNDGVPETSEMRDELCNLVKEKAANYKRLRGGVRFVKIIPKTMSGKLLRRTAKMMEMELRADEKKHKHGHLH